MQRFYIEKDLSKEIITIDEPEMINQFTKVLRLKEDDEVIFFDWKENIDIVFKLNHINKKNIDFVFVKQIIKKENTSKFSLNLFQATPNKLDKIELILQKWTEIWYDKYYFFNSKRSQKLIISENKFERLQRIIIEACEQSGRNIIPEIVFLDKLDINSLKNEKNIFFHTDGNIKTSLKDLSIENETNINIFVWPEWGFDETEIQKFTENNFIACTLWENILRCETAAIVSGFAVKNYI